MNHTTQKRQLKPHLRWLLAGDVPDVLTIERECFEHPWTEDDWRRVLANRDGIALVATVDERVIGYMVYLKKPRHLELLNLAVRRTHRRLGVGRTLVAKLAGKLSPGRRSSVLAAVRERNLSGHQFFAATGWMAVRVVDGYFDAQEDGGEKETAYVFRLTRPQFDDANVQDPISNVQ
ncbi:MAG: GNAT family N-acetyltransferase [bacterium]|nr:GNAT family N-acetyltransferase [bacterium]